MNQPQNEKTKAERADTKEVLLSFALARPINVFRFGRSSPARVYVDGSGGGFCFHTRATARSLAARARGLAQTSSAEAIIGLRVSLSAF